MSMQVGVSTPTLSPSHTESTIFSNIPNILGNGFGMRDSHKRDEFHIWICIEENHEDNCRN